MTTRIKLRRDTAANWADVNPVLALAEPGIETDTNKMKVGDGTKTWTELQYIDGADVTRIKAGWIQSVGYIPEIGNGEGQDFWFESVAVDDNHNTYYVGGNYNDDAPWTVKLDNNGEIVWQTKLNPFDGYAGEGQAVQIDPTNGEIVVIADMWGSIGSGGDAGMLLYRLSPVDGSLIGNPLRIRDDESVNSIDIYPYDLLLDNDGNSIIIGRRNDDKLSVEVSKQTGSNAQQIVILTNILETGAYPRAYDSWYISGTDVNGEGLVTAVNDYTNASASGGTDGHSNASFNFSFYVYGGTTYTSVTVNNSGSGYSVGDVLTVSAADCGGSTNATLTITSLDGGNGVQGFTVTTYSPDLSKVKLTINPNGGSVDFANSGTWNLIQYKQDSGFIRSTQGSGWTAIVGNSDSDGFNAGALDSNGNVYAAGYTYDENYYGGWRRNMLVKFDNTGAVQFKKAFDIAGSEGNDGYTGIAVDSEDNVYIAGGIYDFDDTGDWMSVITKVSSTGALIWQKRFSQGVDSFQMWNMCIAVDSDDNIYLGAEFNSPTSLNDDFFFAKFDKNGNNIWQRMLKSYGDANAQWGNGYQSLKVKGDKLYYCGATEVYTTHGTDTGLAVCLATDGSGLGTIGNTTWEYVDYNLDWSNLSGQASDVQVGVGSAVFTTDEPSTGTDTTSYGNAYLTVYTGPGGVVGDVKELTFEDGTVQKTASKPIIPQNIEGTLHGNNDLYLRLDHAGQFIRVNFHNGNQWIYVPTNANVPFEIGTVITIIADDYWSNSRYIGLQADNNNITQITGVGNPSDDNPPWWDLNRNANTNKTGVYTLMKIDTDRWMLSGTDVVANWD